MKKKYKPGLVSVIVNCYNGAKYLSEAIDSVLSQTYTNFEVIFWDNLSTDASAKIFCAYSDQRLRYFLSSRHTPLYEARNLAIAKANGEFIAFLDIDDWWETDKLERQLTLFENEDVGLVYGNYWLFDQEKNSKTVGVAGDLVVGNVLDDILKNFNVGILTVVVRSSVINRLTGPCDKRLHIIGDFDLFVRLAVETEFSCVNAPVATYRWHDSNDTKTKPVRLAEEWVEWLIEVLSNRSFVESAGFKTRRRMIYKEIARCIALQGSLSPFRKLQSGLQIDVERLISFVMVSFYALLFFCRKQLSESLD